MTRQIAKSILTALVVTIIQALPSSSQAQVTVETLNGPHQHPHCVLSIQYPNCSTHGAAILNDSLLSFVTHAKRQFLKDAKPYLNELDSAMIAGREFPSLYVQVISTYSTPSFVSYCLEVQECPSWGCHGTAQYVAFNFDLHTQSFLQPSQFILTTDTLVCQLVSAYIDSAGLGYEEWNMAHPNCNVNDFTVDVEKSHLVFDFSAYALEPGWYRIAIPRLKFKLRPGI